MHRTLPIEPYLSASTYEDIKKPRQVGVSLPIEGFFFVIN